MFFSKPEEYEPCGIYNIKHLILFLLTATCIALAVKFTKIEKKEDIKNIIKKSTLIIWLLEISKIIFVALIGRGKEINKIVPLYYCSLLLYSGILSSFGKGMLKKMGDVFLSTGGIVAGIVFLLFPTTSLPEYPMIHFISLHSFFFHGTMIYLGIIINKYKYVDLKLRDIKYYSLLIFIICILAYVVNTKYASNLMFISQDFPGTPISKIYNSTGVLYTPIMCLAQMTLPFLIVYGVLKFKEKYGIKM